METSKNERLGQSRGIPFIDRLSDLPYWLLFTILLGVVVFWSILSNDDYKLIFDRLVVGIAITVRVTLIAYSLAMLFGLLISLARVSSNKVMYQIATFYVEIVRGVPILVLLYYIAFAVVPIVIRSINGVGVWMMNDSFMFLTQPITGFTTLDTWMIAKDTPLLPSVADALMGVHVRDLSLMSRAILALTMGYAAFLSEIFRAGIESIERGQMEAARSLGMSYWQAMRHVILPQAIRRVLPPLGNNFVAMLKDSSLVSVLGVRDITLEAKTYSTSTFLYFETYNVLAFLYLSMTIVLSMGVRWMEQRMSSDQ